MWLIRNSIVIIFSFIIAILSLLIYPIDYRYRVSSRLLRFWARVVLFILGVNVRVYGADAYDKQTGRIYISNHASYLDIFVQIAYLPANVRMIYKKEINRIPLLGWAMLATGFIPIDRSNARKAMRSLESATAKISKGLSVVIYPEGTRTRDGSVGEFKRGMFVIAEKSGAEIVPVSLSGTFELMPRGTLKSGSGKVNMVIGKAVKYSEEKVFAGHLREIIINNLKPVSV
jgi:1-acyl-sn-glycerol-3-phosphate acyltransferase